MKTKRLTLESFKSLVKRIIKEEMYRNPKLNEISPDTFKSAINVSKERGTDNRTRNLGSLYFNKFIGTSLMGGKITNIVVENPQQANYRIVQIEFEREDENNRPIKNYIYYDIDKDLYDVDEINRKDAVVLSKIAAHINPNTQYKQTSKFKIQGWY